MTQQSQILPTPSFHSLHVPCHRVSKFSLLGHSSSSPPSTPPSATPPPTTLSSPKLLAQHEGLQVTFDMPRDDGGAPVESFVIRLEPEGEQVEVHASPADITGLSSDKIYRAKVAAQNKAGIGPWSKVSRSVRPMSSVLREP